MDVPEPSSSTALSDPFAVHLTWARQELANASAMWHVSGIVTDFPDDNRVQHLTQTVRTLEALQSAASVSRLLYGDCVEMPSKDPRYLKDPAILHSLLLQQLNSLATRLGSRSNTAGAVPLAIRPAPPEPSPPPPPLSQPQPVPKGEHTEDEPQEEEQGGTCTIA